MKHFNKFLLGICGLSLVLTLFTACHEDEVIDTPNIDLSFSQDTLRFDTVFTEVGTVTRFLKVYNNELEAVILDKISIENGASSFFRMNADGLSGQSLTDVRVEGQDSIYIFIEATIDPDNPLSISPYVIEDKLLIEANESAYKVNIEAWGQNANYIPDPNAAATVTPATCNGSIIWDDPKPYVIYGVLDIQDCDLIIEAGTRVYMHGGVAINENGIYNDGLIIIRGSSSLTVNGTVENPVYFLSDRLEEEFAEVQGQWGGILILADSQNNKIDHAIIQHSIVGISVDSSSFLEIKNTEISFTSGSGLIGSHATIVGTNCLFHNNATSGISLNYGGNYGFYHCTVGNYDNQSPAISLNNIKCSDPLCQEEVFVYPLSAEFDNCIFVGNEIDEISLLDLVPEEPGFFDYQFDNCIVNVDELLDAEAYPNFFDNCDNCLNLARQDTIFEDILAFDYHLDSLSIAIDYGNYLQGIDTDLDGNSREIDAVDAGCYEYQK